MRWALAVALVACAAAARADFINEQTPSGTPTQATCTGASSVVTPGTNSGRARTVLNQSSTPAFICFAPVCTLAIGTRFIENMGFIEQTYTGAISCITAGGTATLGVTVR